MSSDQPTGTPNVPPPPPPAYAPGQPPYAGQADYAEQPAKPAGSLMGKVLGLVIGIGGGVGVVVGVAMAVLWPLATTRARGAALQANSLANLKQIGLAIQIVHRETEQYPAALDDPKLELDPQGRVCPATGKPYTMVAGLERLKDPAPPDMPLVFGEPFYTGERPVVFGDGTPRILDRAEFRDALKRAEEVVARAPPPAGGEQP